MIDQLGESGNSSGGIMPDFDLLGTPEVRALVELVERRLSKPPEEAAACHREFEEELRAHTMAVERAVHTVDLERLDIDVPAVVADGVRCRRTDRSPSTLLTMAGRVTSTRTVYRERGGHGGKTFGYVES
jgi:hypothetical protein